MCNLYRQDVAPAGLVHFFEDSALSLSETARGRNVEAGYVGADQDGPVLVNAGDGKLEIAIKRWGFPAIREGAKPITNIRNLDSSWWRGANGAYLMEPEYRCLVPFSAFAEWNRDEKRNSWFEVDSEAPMFAGIWRPWTGERLAEVPGKSRRQRQVQDWSLFAFLTTEPNSVVAPIHPKAMPAILTTSEECARWMAGGEASLDLQRPLPDALVTHGK